MKTRVLKLFILIILLALPRIPGTSSSYVDTESASVSMSAGVWEVEEDEPEVAGTVVINEIMWMGSSAHDNDEWIELRNMTSETINLAGWYLTGAGAGASIITLTGSIEPNGYYLISNYNPTSPQSALHNSIVLDQPAANVSFLQDGEVISLYNSTNVLVDQTPSGNWAAGVDGPPLFQSMERNSDPTTGWHTCISAGCNDVGFWDTEGSNYGTPRAENLSENDPSLRIAAPISEAVPLPPAINYFAKGEDGKTVSFSLSNVDQFTHLKYMITYTTYDTVRGVGPSTTEISGQRDYQSPDIDLATCSDGVCTYDENVHQFLLEITLTNEKGDVRTLTSSF